jgi:hypothetical protein
MGLGVEGRGWFDRIGVDACLLFVWTGEGVRRYMKYIFVSLMAMVVLSGCSALPGRQAEETGNAGEEREMAAALESGKPVYCVMTDAEGSRMEYEMKGGKMRVAGMAVGESTGYMINDGMFIYIWEEGSAEGVKMPVPSEEDVAEAQDAAEEYTRDVPDFYNEDSVAEYEDQGYVIDCQPRNVADEVFVPPMGVNFVDTGAMMQNALQEMQQQGLEESQLPPEAQQQMEQYREQMGL